MKPEEGAEIVEIGAVKIIHGVVSDQIFEQLIRPARTMPAQMTAISGISSEMLVDKPMMKDVLPGFLDWAGSDILVAQNHTFDMGFLRHHIQLLGIPYPGHEVMDTMLLSRKLYPNEKAGLDALIKRFGLSMPDQRHRALDDAKVTAEIFIKMMNIIRDNGGDTFETLRPAKEFAT